MFTAGHALGLPLRVHTTPFAFLRQGCQAGLGLEDQLAHMLASASDDHSVRIWTARTAAAGGAGGGGGNGAGR